MLLSFWHGIAQEEGSSGSFRDHGQSSSRDMFKCVLSGDRTTQGRHKNEQLLFLTYPLLAATKRDLMNLREPHESCDSTTNSSPHIPAPNFKARPRKQKKGRTALHSSHELVRDTQTRARAQIWSFPINLPLIMSVCRKGDQGRFPSPAAQISILVMTMRGYVRDAQSEGEVKGEPIVIFGMMTDGY